MIFVAVAPSEGRNLQWYVNIFLKIVTFDLHLFSLVTFSSSSFIKTNINPKAFVCRMVWIWWRISWLITGKFASNKTLRSVLSLSASNMKKEIPWFVWTIYPDWVTFCHWEVYDREVSIWPKLIKINLIFRASRGFSTVCS